MGEQPPPPVITITDPSAPAPLSDVIGEDAARPPRRLSAQQRRLAWLTTAIVVTGAAGVWAAGRIQRDHQLDRQALGELSVVTVTTDGVSGGENHLDLSLLNQGPHPVTVVWARLDAAGFPELVADKNTLPPADPQLVSFPLPKRCPRTLGSVFTAPVLLRVRTYRGDDRTLRFEGDPSESSFAAGFVFTTMARCGLFPPEFSLQLAGPVVTERLGGDLRLTLPVYNRSADQRSVASFAVSGGLALVASSTPVEIPGHGAARLQVRLRVTDCTAASGSWAFAAQQQGFTPTFRAVSGDGELDAVVNAQQATGVSATLLTAAGDNEVARWVLERCPS
ncbi:MAG: hypothetical protein JWP14_1986 [Frankiales bacterium]|nr:hypothetical protein [Frankiales bacterium]